MEFILSILLAYGVTNIIVQGTIFIPFKNWLKKYSIDHPVEMLYNLLNCPMCSGFWVGAIIGIFYGPFDRWNILFNGALYSGTTWLIYCFAQFLGQGYDPSRTLNVNITSPVDINNNVKR